MKRVIVDIKKLNNELLNLLATKYPDGCDDDSIVTFKNQHNEIIECVEVRTEETIYLVKISKRLVSVMKDDNLDIDTIADS